MIAAFAAANAPHATSSQWLRSHCIAVADVANRLDDLVSELAAKPAHVDVDDVRARVEGVAPDGREELLTGADLTLFAHQVFEEQDLPGREVDALAVRDDSVAPEIQPEGAVVDEPGCGPIPRVAQARARTDQQLGDRERLRHVVGDAELEAPDLRLDVREGRQDQ